MDDNRIIELYWARSEEAIQESDRKFGPYCRTIAWNILQDREDSEECVNDTWLQAWNAMPPQRPSLLRAFLAKITRNLALDKYRFYVAQKRILPVLRPDHRPDRHLLRLLLVSAGQTHCDPREHLLRQEPRPVLL